MRTGITSLVAALASASAVQAVAIICGAPAGADPDQDQQFLALLAQEQIPAIDNVPGIVYRAHEICSELDGGTSVQTVITDEMNSAYGDNPGLRLYPARVQRTAVRFVTASVDVYCPGHKGELP